MIENSVKSAVSFSSQKKRIFWLGMHKILKPTELRRLRTLGYEVFNPPYISPVFDQSADLKLDFDQPTTLPEEVFTALMKHDFFYTTVPPEIAEILNEYFDAIIVTINADWLKSIVDVFEGQVIYRIYGQHFNLSDKIIEIGLWRSFIQRDNIFVVPFADESIEREHQWFLEKCTEAVPYQIPDDVFEFSGNWSAERACNEIFTSIPNMQNPYFGKAYDTFSRLYPQSFFRIYGPQRMMPPDGRIVGNLDRPEFLKRMRMSLGFFYNYDDDVCYLPPIEMMQIGGPVLYASGSLLSRFVGSNGPGAVHDAIEGEEKFLRILNKDKGFIDEILASQETTRQRYDRELVCPIFDKRFRMLLGSPGKTPSTTVEGSHFSVKTTGSSYANNRQTVVIPLHIEGLFVYEDGRPGTFEGIPRVVDCIVDVLMAFSNANLIVSCAEKALPVIHDFFWDHLALGRISIIGISLDDRSHKSSKTLTRLEFIQYIDELPLQDKVIFVPHYYHFPEFILSKTQTALYLPDYFPFLSPNEIFDLTVERDKRNKTIGILAAKYARKILTNSEFTKRYLPDAGFVEKNDDRVVVAPLPFLGENRARALNPHSIDKIRDRVGAAPFLFYPTQNRPNKKIAFLMQLYKHLLLRWPDLSLVLTCDLGSYPEAYKAALEYELIDRITLLQRVSEPNLQWLYENTAALCLTSVIEGNFPPQMIEALNYRSPIVATRLPTVTEVLGELSDKLLLCRPTDLLDFSANVTKALENREEVLQNQSEVRDFMRDWNSQQRFARELSKVLPQINFVGVV